MTYQPDIVLYHANCADGFGAAWAAWMKWGSTPEYRAVSYGEKPPINLAGKHVLIGDFSYKRDVIQELSACVKSLIILDHHQTAEADLSLYALSHDIRLDVNNAANAIDAVGTVAVFDMNRSGARMMWDFCFPGEEAPMLIKLIEDRDLWRFWFEETKPFGVWLRCEPFDFERWEMIAQELGDGKDCQRIMDESAAMQRFFDQKVAEIARLSRISLIDGHEVPVCNCPPMFASEVGHRLLDDHPAASFVACYSDQGKARGYSLRSRDGRMDVSAIAKKFGGGGHRNAAGFGVPLP